MSSRLKRNCKMCKKRSNLAFDPEKVLCPDCLILWRDNVVREHKAGKITFQKAYESILKRCRMNEGILVTGYKTGDYLMTRYKRGVLDDQNAEAIVHTEEDYEWISGVSQDALEAQGMNLAGAIGPGGLAVIANGVWFGTPLMRIQKEAKKSPFQGRVGGAIGRFVERLPIIGKRIKDRRLRTLQQEIEQDGEHS